MPWMEWLALKHALFVHVPAAVGLLLPWALIAAQRPGRGIKPWWTVCRYLGGMGLAFSLVGGLSGLWVARGKGLLGPTLLAGSGQGLLRQHQILLGAGLVLGILAMRSFYRKRQEHQGLGALSLLLGLLWSASLVYGAFLGGRMVEGRPLNTELPKVAPKAAAVVPAPAAPAERSGEPPLRVLDYQALLPMHAEPVRSALHANRWVRVWVNPEAEAAYRAGQPLPEGALVVMNAQEDRWGRPGPDAGPLCAMEIRGGKPSFTYYWPRVPEAKRGETAGQARALWQGGDPNLAGCLACHGAGLAAAKDRSTWTVPRKPKAAPDTPKPLNVP